MRILFIVAYVPNLIRTRPYNLIRSLAARGHQVTVGTLWAAAQEQADIQALEQHCHRVIALPLPRWRPVGNCLRALPTDQPLQAHYAWQPDLARRLDDALRGSQFDLIHVEHLRAARYGLYLQAHTALPVIWDSVDCISHLFEQAARRGQGLFARVIARLELPRTRRYEGWLVHQFDHVLVTSPVDKAALIDLAHSQFPIPNSQFPISVLPNGVDLDYFTPGAEPREPATLVFSGKMSYHANITAALHLVHDIMPRIWSRRPDVRLWIVGKDPPREVRRLADSKIQNPKSKIVVTGAVPDIRPYLQRATAAVAPVPYGAGIQNKVLEALACRTPVVASPQACTALQVQAGEHLLLADGPERFAQAVLGLLADPARQQKLAQAGRRYVEERHDWDQIAAHLSRIYRAVIAGRPSVFSMSKNPPAGSIADSPRNAQQP